MAIPAAAPQPAALPAPIAERDLEKRQINGLETGVAAEQGQDLKGSSSYGYGYVENFNWKPICS